MADADLEAGAGPGGDKPLRAKDVDTNLLKPKLELFPNLCTNTRENLYKWYPGPGICAHRMHWTEWFFVIFTALAVVFFVIGADNIPIPVMGLLLSVVSFFALIFVWGFAKYKSLADAADRLEKVAMENHTSVCALTEINNGWEESIEENQKNQDRFAQSMGLVSNDANAIAQLTDSLSKLVDAKRDLQNEEKQLFQTTIKVEEVTRQEAREKEITVLKQKFERNFDHIDRKQQKGSPGLYGNLEGEQIEEIKKMLARDPFLNSKKEGTDEPMFNWLPMFEEAAKDGKLAKYEILHVLENATDSYFIHIKDAFEEEKRLQAQLKEVTGKRKR